MADKRWKDVPRAPYRVSDRGDIESFARGAPRMLKPARLNGYFVVTIAENGAQPKTHYVHHLVAEAFLPPKPSPLHEINHKDGNRENQSADNLEWVTRSGQQIHRYRVLKHRAPRGEMCHRAKLTFAQVFEIRERVKSGERASVVAHHFGITPGNVKHIYRGSTWKLEDGE